MQKGDKFKMVKDQSFLLKKGDTVWLNDTRPGLTGKLFVGPVEANAKDGFSAMAVYVDAADLEPIVKS